MAVGIEWWPAYNDGTLFKLGDVIGCDNTYSAYRVYSITFSEQDGLSLMAEDQHTHKNVCIHAKAGEQLRRPPVLAADGKPIEVGQTVWEVDGTGHSFKVVSIRPDTGRAMEPTVVTCDTGDGTSEHFLPVQLTHQAPVLDADGVPINVGDTVWHKDGTELKVLDFDHEEDGDTVVNVAYVSGLTDYAAVRAQNVTHTKPEADSWERIERDAEECDESWAFEYGHNNDSVTTVRDLVRRCKKLAGLE